MTINKLFLVESGIVLALAVVITESLVVSNYTMHFQQVVLNFYADKTTDFSTNATSLVRGLGNIDLLTLVFGLSIGAAMALTSTNGDRLDPRRAKDVSQLSQYEKALMSSGLVGINKTAEGTTYQVTEMGRRFLTEFSYLQHKCEE